MAENDRDQVVILLERALAARAQTAIASHDLAGRARTRRRRHAVRRAGVVGGASLAAVAAIVAPMVIGSSNDLMQPTDQPTLLMHGAAEQIPAKAAPDGWRWESYGMVQVLVPTDWGLGYSGAGCWDTAEPAVGRPPMGDVPLCLRASALELRIPFVWFLDAPAIDPDVTDEWVVESTTVSGQTVSVFSDDPDLRAEVIASVEPLDEPADGNGCMTTHPISAEFGWRPTHATPLEDLRDVTAVALCRYALPDPYASNAVAVQLLQSGRLSGDSAQRVVAAAAEGAPVSADGCEPLMPYGYTATVLRIEHAGGVSEALLSIEGCARVGTDDGTTIHAPDPTLATALLQSDSAYGRELGARVQRVLDGQPAGGSSTDG